MQCPRCRAENREGRRFCGECGVSFALRCPSCGFVNEGSEKFCGGCGVPMAGSAAASEDRFGPPETYPPPAPRRSSPPRRPWRASASR
jgi:hypothetical protein